MTDVNHQIQQLRSTLSKMEIALGTVEECIVWTDHTGRIKWCNSALERLFGQSRLFLLSALLIEKLPLSAEGVRITDTEHPVNLALVQQQSGKRCYEFDGATGKRILEISWSFVAIDDLANENHNMNSSVLVLRDITQQRLAEAQLQESKKNLEIQVQERTQELQAANLKLQAESAQLQQLITELQDTQTQLIQAEKMSGLGQLVAGIAHEINNPINFIQGNLQYLSSYTDSLLELIQLYQMHYPQPVTAIDAKIAAIDLPFIQSDLHKLMKSMVIGTQRISEIVVSLRNFSRLDEADVKPCDLHEGLESTLLILQHRLNQPGARPIQVVREYSQLPLVNCHASQINQVFMNIIANAIDAIEEASAKQLAQGQTIQEYQITIRTQQTEEDTVEIILADNGTGIPKEIQQKIFNPFFTTKPVGKGTGMGMAISYKIITEKHGGSLICQSQIGQGTRFIIRLPITPAVPITPDRTQSPNVFA